MDRIVQLYQVQDEAAELFTKKNKDYGDAFATYGTIGVLVRMSDKISRAISITNNSINLINTESLRDTLIDLHNYSAMAIMLIDNQKNTNFQIRKREEIPNEITTYQIRKREEIPNENHHLPN